MKKRILVVGSLNMDLILRISEMPRVGETIIGQELRYSPGGKGANQAYTVGRMGGEVSMLGAVGNDGFGAELLQNLSGAGVDISKIQRDSSLPTGTAVIYVDDEGNNNIVVVSGANTQCDKAYLEQHDHMLRACDYLLLQLEIPPSAAWYAVRRAKELGKTVLLNPAPAPKEIPGDILSLLDYITPNETELASLSGMACNTDQEIELAAQKLAHAGVSNVLVTLGAQGGLWTNGKDTFRFPSADLKAVDSTGAGDCFNGALVTALAEGQTLDYAISFASAASGIAVTRMGAQSSLPSREEVDLYITKNG